MPNAPLHPCNHPRCPALVPRGESYCEEHKKELRYKQDQTRPGARQRGYTAVWEKVRKSFLSANPICERCKANNEIVLARLVHHRDRNPKNNEWANLEALCTTCHDAEHKHERFTRKNQKSLSEQNRAASLAHTADAKTVFHAEDGK